MKCTLIFILLFLTKISYCQDSLYNMTGKFVAIPEFNSTCGYMVTAELVHISTDKDTVDAYIMCSERFKNREINFNNELLFRVKRTSWSEIGFTVIGIPENKNSFLLISNISEIE